MADEHVLIETSHGDATLDMAEARIAWYCMKCEVVNDTRKQATGGDTEGDLCANCLEGVPCPVAIVPLCDWPEDLP